MTLRAAAAACALALASLTGSELAVARGTLIGDTGPGAPVVQDMAVNSAGELVVHDGIRIATLAADGSPLRSFEPDDEYNGTPLLTIGTDDSIFVSSDWGQMIRRYDRTGVLQAAWGDGAEGDPATIRAVRELAADRAGRVYVAHALPNGSGDRVAVFSESGELTGGWPVVDAAGGDRWVRALAARGGTVAVLTSGSAGGELIRYDPAGKVLSRWRAVWASDVALARNGDVFIAGGSTIAQFNTAAELVSIDAARGPEDYLVPSDVCAPSRDVAKPWYEPWNAQHDAIAVADAGDVYSRNYQPGILRFDARPVAELRVGPVWGYGSSGPFPVTGQQITFDASWSRLPFFPRMTFEWDLDGDGVYEKDTGTEPRISHAYATAGPRRVAVRVTGPTGLAAAESAEVSVAESKAILARVPRALTGSRVAFDASGSRLPCSTVLKHEWDLDSDGVFETDTGASPNAQWTYPQPGSYAVLVRVTRPGGRVDVAWRRVDVYLAPPPGQPGIVINGGARFTRDPVVQVTATWPAFTSRMRLTSDPAFTKSVSFPIGEPQTWRLDTSGSERVPKRIHARFDAAKDQTFSDDIVLDRTPPRVTVARRRAGRLRLRARDNSSGVAAMQLAADRRRPRGWVPMGAARARTSGRELWVRVRDAAGNRSRWRRAD